MKIINFVFKHYLSFFKKDIQNKDKKHKNIFVNYSGILVLLTIPILKLKQNDSLFIILCAFCSILADGLTFGVKTNVFNIIDRWISTLAFIIITKNVLKNIKKDYIKTTIYFTHILISLLFYYKSKTSLSTIEYNKYHGIWHFYGLGIGNLILFYINRF